MFELEDQVYIIQHNKVIQGTIIVKCSDTCFGIRYQHPHLKDYQVTTLDSKDIYKTQKQAEKALKNSKSEVKTYRSNWTSHANRTIEEFHNKYIHMSVVEIEPEKYLIVAYDTDNLIGSYNNTIKAKSIDGAKLLAIRDIQKQIMSKLNYVNSLNESLNSELFAIENNTNG